MKLSIITINRNNSAGLEKTCQSVVCQTFEDFEWLVIDGASNDNSVDIIKKYAHKITYWISEPDTGVYNAMNKGIRKAQGEYCLFLNSGDWLISSSTLESVFNEIKGIPPSDIYYSDKIDSDNGFTYYPTKLTLNYLFDSPISHQNSLIRRSLFIEHGYYNESLKISSDWEFFLNELWKYKTGFSYLETNISVYDTHGISSIDSPERANEIIMVYKDVFYELADVIMEMYNFRRTIYYDIIKNYGTTPRLTFILRLYRKTIKIIRRITCFFTNHTKKISNKEKITNPRWI